MQVLLDCVRVFHEKVVGRSESQPLSMEKNDDLWDAASKLSAIALSLQEHIADSDLRYLRAHLMIEELGECVNAMGLGDEVGVLDGLSDLLYVLFGTAVDFDLPLEEGFCDVHVSNMTKIRQTDDDYGPRVRDKGPTFTPPDLQRTLDAYRESQRRGRRVRSPASDMIAALDGRYRESLQPCNSYQEMDQATRTIIDGACNAVMWSRELHERVITALTAIVNDYHEDFNREVSPCQDTAQSESTSSPEDSHTE
jgi:predicted HAD superfamily Cof-like phosphohydrolase